MPESDTREPRLLVIDDEDSICLAFRRFFERRGWTVNVCSSGGDGRAAFERESPDVTFLDIRLPDADGLEVLRELHERRPGAAVIMITAFGGLETVVGSLQADAYDYLPKPIDLDEALKLAERALEQRRSAPGAPAPPAASGEQLVGASPAMQAVYKRIAVLARDECSVLLLGETGTGKEMVARAIHAHSRRSDGPFVAVNCGGLPETLVESELFGHVRGSFTGADADRTGRFEAAEGGTLFLDEVGELPESTQVKLLRVLDSRQIERVGSTHPRQLDVRIVAATNRDLFAAVRNGRFRADLYYRLAVVQVELPPLRERRTDILPLAEHFIAAAGRGTGAGRIDPDAAEALRDYDWPGNVRELRNAVQHALAVSPGGPVRLEDLPDPLRRPGDGAEDGASDAPAQRYVRQVPDAAGSLWSAGIEPVERELIRRAMRECDGNRSEAAELLGIHRNTLRKKLRELGL